MLLRLAARRLYCSPTTPVSRFRLLPFRSPLLRESLLLSFPLATKMFQFARLSLACPWIQQQFESVVIVEGDPLPSATRGRISFLNFNPSIDKLNQDASGPSETESPATSSGRQNEEMSMRENGSSKYRLDKLELGSSSDDANGDIKRKRADASPLPEHPNKSRKNDENNQDSSPSRSHGSKKKDKREKLDWSVLRPPRHQSKKR